MCYDTSTFCTEVWIIHTRTCWRQPVTAAGPGCNQRLDSGWTESLNRVTCKLCENREQHRSLIIRDRGVCCSYSSYHPVARIERAEPEAVAWKSNKKETRNEGTGGEQKGDELAEESSEHGLELLLLRPAGTDCETNTLRTATEGGEERGSRETEEAISGVGWRLSTT